MTFRKRLEIIREKLQCSFSLKRRALLVQLEEILEASIELLKVEEFKYWLELLRGIELEEIPITKYGVSNALALVQSLELNRESFKRKLPRIAENLITFQVEDDLCERQGQYYYYFDTSTKSVFQESEMGCLRPENITVDRESIRLARKSDLIELGILDEAQKSNLYE